MDNKKAHSFSDLLFELSNEIRFNILKSIQNEPKRPSVIANQLGLSPPEVSRNFSRLYDSSLVTKDIENYYSITNLGEHVLTLLEDLEFIYHNRNYFVSHSSVKIPSIFQKRISELNNYSLVTNSIEFLTAIFEIIRDSKEFIWMYIDQYPLIVLDAIRSSIEKRTQIRIIEQKNLLGPHILFDKKYMIETQSKSPDIQIKIQDECKVYLVVSDAGAVVAFPTETGYDYSGFISKNKDDSKWCIDVFNHYWELSEKADLSQLAGTQDVIDLSNHTNTKRRADEWLRVFSRLPWFE